jgi:hypothetical protein
MSAFVFHILEYITVKTSFFIIENTISVGYYIGSSAASYLYSTLTNKNDIKCDSDSDKECTIEQMKMDIIHLRSKVDELEKQLKE